MLIKTLIYATPAVKGLIKDENTKADYCLPVFKSNKYSITVPG